MHRQAGGQAAQPFPSLSHFRPAPLLRQLVVVGLRSEDYLVEIWPPFPRPPLPGRKQARQLARQLA